MFQMPRMMLPQQPVQTGGGMAQQAMGQMASHAFGGGQPQSAMGAPAPQPQAGGQAMNAMQHMGALGGQALMQRLGGTPAPAAAPAQSALMNPLQRLGASAGGLMFSDERLKTDVDRAGVDRQFRMFFDSIAPEKEKRSPATGLDSSLAAKALRRG